MDLRDAAVLGHPELADEGEDVQAELAVGQGPRPLGLGAVRPVVPRARRPDAAADAEGQPVDPGEGRDGAAVVVGHVRGAPAVRTAVAARLQEPMLRGGGAAGAARHRTPPGQPGPSQPSQDTPPKSGLPPWGEKGRATA
jgi:hypothetical protein